VRAIAEVFKGGFARLRQRHPAVLVEAHQRGMMMGLKLASPHFGPWMTAAGFHAGLLVIFANNDPSVIQILPPLTIQEDEVQQVLDILDGMLVALERTIQ
jgi:acetylornithine/succinyldiaminopimelate/putrescine aminotransferase